MLNSTHRILRTSLWPFQIPSVPGVPYQMQYSVASAFVARVVIAVIERCSSELDVEERHFTGGGRSQRGSVLFHGTRALHPAYKNRITRYRTATLAPVARSYLSSVPPALHSVPTRSP